MSITLKFYLLISIILLVSCSSSDKRSITTSNNSLIEKDTLKSYDIKGFISFNDTTNYNDVIKYLNSHSLTYKENPDLLSFNYFERYDFPQSTFWVTDCPHAKFLWIPELHVEELTFKKTLFCFYQNRICFITLREHTNNPKSYFNIQKLKKLYSIKYGEGYEYYNDADTINGGKIVNTSKSLEYPPLAQVFR